MSLSNLAHRRTISTNKTQNALLRGAMDTSGLTDAYLHRHGTQATYRTWEMRTSQDNPTWTSPDHILVSSHSQCNITAAQVDDTTLEHGMDHSVVTATLHIKQNKTIKRTLHVKLKCLKKDTDKYNDLVTKLLPFTRANREYRGRYRLHPLRNSDSLQNDPATPTPQIKGTERYPPPGGRPRIRHHSSGTETAPRSPGTPV